MTGNVAHSLRLAAALAERVGGTEFQAACVGFMKAALADRADLEGVALAAPLRTPEIALSALHGPLAEPVRETLILADRALRALPDADLLRAVTDSVRSAAEIPRAAWLRPRLVAEEAVFGVIGRLAVQPEILTSPEPDTTPGYDT